MNNDPGNLVLWVGAGLSSKGVRSGGRGLPTWKELAIRMVNHLAEHGGLSERDLDRLRRALDRDQYLTVADEFKAQPEFWAFLKRELDPPDIVESSLHELILSVGFKAILTTNLDLVFERQPSRPHTVFRYPECLGANQVRAMTSAQGFLLKIHGDLYPTNKLVLTRREYNNLSRRKSYQALLQARFITSPVLIVGFSLRDPDFRLLIRRIGKLFLPSSSTALQAFALMRRQDPNDAMWKTCRELGVQVIPYQERGELRQLFSQLRDLRERLRPDPRLRVSASSLQFRPPLRVKDVKGKAWEFYKRWHAEGSNARALGDARVNVTVKGWRHLTRADLPAQEVCRRLSLLPLARAIVERAPAVVRDDLRVDGRRRLLSLQGTHRSGYGRRSAAVVEVIIEQRPAHGGSDVTYTFLSVH